MASKRKKCLIENYYKKNRDFFVVLVVLCVSCSCIPVVLNLFLTAYHAKVLHYRCVSPSDRGF